MFVCATDGCTLGLCVMQRVSDAGDIGGQAGIVVRVVVTDEFCVFLFARLMGALLGCA